MLASILTRLRRDSGGRVPLVAQWDVHERVFTPPMPYLFQRRRGPTRHATFSRGSVSRLINKTVAAAGLRDRDGAPLVFTPHDFRRMFATDAVTGGLPVHIAARLLGHHNLATTQAYLAVFQDDLVRAYRGYLQRRRELRPPAEYREPTAEEWAEFEAHFERRKLELGTCGRPYGTPCQHEHACIRCPMLRVDPSQRQRLVEILRNLADRIDEAQVHGWLGKIEGLKTSLAAGRAKLAALERARAPGATVTDLGIPLGPGQGRALTLDPGRGSVVQISRLQANARHAARRPSGRRNITSPTIVGSASQCDGATPAWWTNPPQPAAMTSNGSPTTLPHWTTR